MCRAHSLREAIYGETYAYIAQNTWLGVTFPRVAREGMVILGVGLDCVLVDEA